MALDDPPRLEMVLNNYREWLVGAGLAQKTITTYGIRLRQAQEVLADWGTNLDDAKPTQIRAMAETFPGSTSTQRQIRSALKWYFEMTGRPHPPHRAVRVPPKPRPQNKALEPEAASLLAKTARSWFPEGTAVMLGLYMALRASEIASFRLSRITGDGEWYTVTGKGSRTHTLPMHPLLGEEIDAVRRFVSSDFLFPGQRGRDHVAYQTVWNWVQRVSDEAGIGKVHPHQLRHTALTTAHDSTGDLLAVSQYARHSDVSSTQRYTRTTDDQLRRVMLAIDYG